MVSANKEISMAIANKGYGKIKPRSDNVTALSCQNFDIGVPVDGFVTVHADFVINVGGSYGAEEVSEAVRRVTYYLCSGRIDLVKATDKPRCFYCGTLGEREDMKCDQCGGAF